MPDSLEHKRDLLRQFRKRSEEGGGPDRVAKQHAEGKYTARERIDRLVDPGSFLEFDKFVVHNCRYFGMDKKQFMGDGVVTGIAAINGQKVAVYSQDFTVLGGSLGGAHAQKIVKVMEFAAKTRIPMIGINDSGGARIQEGVVSLGAYAEIFRRNVDCSGIIPQISLIMGPCAGGAVYSPAMTDFIFMVDRTSYMFVTGPDVIKAVTHEEITKEELGGAGPHSAKSGVAHFKCTDEDECFERVRELLTYIPAACDAPPTRLATTDPVDRENVRLREIVPANPKKPYDIKEIILDVLDDAHFLEVQKDYAKNIVCGFGSIGGIKVGVVANQPMVLAGVLDTDSSAKAARFVRFCDAFGIPIFTLVDVPGFMPGVGQEHGGIIRQGAKLLYAYCEARVPMVTLITRKAYGGAYDVMASKHIGGDVNLAYPTAEIAVMGVEGAVSIIFRGELSGLNGDAFAAKKQELVDGYEQEFSNPYKAAELGYLDEVIMPEETRSRVYRYFEALTNKHQSRPHRFHGNIPL
ncbi:MAG: acyl-CoA carboxylase subunit beta [bacterium]|nr:acyl-CoA carboxylase subunit beta [bacterium]